MFKFQFILYLPWSTSEARLIFPKRLWLKLWKGWPCCFRLHVMTWSNIPLRSWADKHHNKSGFLPLHFSPSDSSDKLSPSLWSGCLQPRGGRSKKAKNISIKDYVWVVISDCLCSDNRKICGFGWKMKRRWGEAYNNQVWALAPQF